MSESNFFSFDQQFVGSLCDHIEWLQGFELPDNYDFMAKIKIKLGGDEHEFPIEAGESVLDAALRNNLEAPYSCMEGVCTACMAKITEGEVDFPDDTSLRAGDRAQGLILTCQAKIKPGCEKLAVDYDAI